jgi:hypothetical protein
VIQFIGAACSQLRNDALGEASQDRNRMMVEAVDSTKLALFARHVSPQLPCVQHISVRL